MRIGVDTGGTFTDCVRVEGSEVRILKVFTTPDDAARGIVEGVRRLAAPTDAARIREPLEVIHGTTVGTNTLLERRGARVALVTTAGFEDLIEIGRQARPRLYDLNVQREPALVRRAFRWGVAERTAADGRVLLRPTPASLRRLAQRIHRSRAESVAVCFLFSFRNPANERAVARAVAKLGLAVSVSHEILPEFREYERLSTVVINAYLAPRLGAYLARLERAVGEGSALPRTRVFVMQSSGGITTAARAAREPVRTILSGPVGGVVAAAWLANHVGLARAISFDMGGTSTDVCLFEGRPPTTSETTLGGLPVAVPVLDIHSVGAGGGSLARLDAGGALRVGPESAGAVPGPACYGRGSARPTVTDANLVLGRLDPEYFLGGTFRLDTRAAEASFHEFLTRKSRRRDAARLGLTTPRDLARGILAVSNATMEHALRVVSVERGHDPRDFALICFGGAGGLHAAELASALGLARVIVPRHPGAFSALGILLSDIVRDISQSVLLSVPDAPASERSRRVDAARAFARDLDQRFTKLERKARQELAREQLASGSAGRAIAERRLDVRYAGQSYELEVAFSPDFRDQFHREHERAYGHSRPGRPLEVVSLRLRLIVATAKPVQASAKRRRGRPLSREVRAAIVKRKPVWFGKQSFATPLYERERLPVGAEVAGPAIIAEYSSTTVVPPGWACRADEYGNLVLTQHAR
ncbi:MAG TPA: hydantoinase/oxoprolinase family protein [Terriglobia bacterium]|nr:hydantoinase/oxoprolinase family protein [Terriglobia bacterium]